MIQYTINVYIDLDSLDIIAKKYTEKINSKLSIAITAANIASILIHL